MIPKPGDAPHGEDPSASRRPPDAASPLVPDLVARAARANPAAIALTDGVSAMSYGTLDADAGRLAAHLRSLSVEPETVVGICLSRSFEQVVAILAVMKAGGAFLPLDPSWPENRCRAVLDDAKASVLIGVTETIAHLADDARPSVMLDRDGPAIAAYAAGDGLEMRAPESLAPESLAPESLAPESLAYVIYTSGSTGEPKGVEITHGNLLNLVRWHLDAFGVTAADRASHLAGLGFDAAVWEIWPNLCAGASVALIGDMARTSAGLLQRWLVEQQVTVAFVPTALAEPMIGAEWPADGPLRLLLTGADTLHSRPRPDLPFAVVNNYGPTECAVVATSGAVPPDGAEGGRPTIGRPIANTQIHILDERGAPVADGELGEIHIGGASVGRGYRGRPDLTAQAFPTLSLGSGPSARFYRTGDLARRLPDGQIAFHGRTGDQVKIRGYRVEPDEVSAILNRDPNIAASAVVARNSPPYGSHLVAYVVPSGRGDVGAAALRERLAVFLPDYMIPSFFARLTALPLTANGKLDKAALPEPDAGNALSQVDFRAPGTPAEKRLAEIVAGALKIDQIGVDDNFFLLGGHSLLATQVVLRAQEAFGVDLTLLAMFEAQTVANLAVTVERLLLERLATMSEADAQRLIEN
jgi:amino acid adenylation domain-containing protein